MIADTAKIAPPMPRPTFSARNSVATLENSSRSLYIAEGEIDPIYDRTPGTSDNGLGLKYAAIFDGSARSGYVNDFY